MFTTFILFVHRFSIILSRHSDCSYVRDKNVYLYAIWYAILSLLCDNMECWPYVSLHLQLATTLIFNWWEEGMISRVEWRLLYI